jgi:RecJ-like exonuclease
MNNTEGFVKIRCKNCVGSGKVMGGGMLMADCDECEGVGKLYIKKEDKSDSEENSPDNL